MFELKVVRERRAGYGSARRVTTPAAVYEAFRERGATSDREEFIVLPLDSKNTPLGFHVCSVGTVGASLVHPREVFKIAILANAAAVILVHNHPSGDPLPSAEDKQITKRIREAGELMGISVLDHVIIGDGRYYSFVDEAEFRAP